MSPARPQKRFSQNFLIDRNIAEKIVALINPGPKDVVFEIGAGRGILTEIIAVSGARLLAFELDRNLIPALERKFRPYENVEIIQADFISVNPGDFHSGGFKLIGNIPYDITSQIIDWVIRNRKLIQTAVITAQAELAQRIASEPGSKHWAPISIFTQLFYDIRLALAIPAKSFEPPPKVKSATMSFSPREKYSVSDWEWFEKIVRLSFRQRRKLLVNNLSGMEGISRSSVVDAVDRLGLDRNARAEEIDIATFIHLAESLSKIY
jgi:16S rRNA (adenine1518-N6/adenine1519-N6)-dimethyltransferase